jgi:hypothetical protein
MRALAVDYVASDNFLALPARDAEPAHRSRHEVPHCPSGCSSIARMLADDIVRTARTLSSGGKLFVVNRFRRAVPTVGLGWADDGRDVFGLLRVALIRAPEEDWPARARPRGSPVGRRGRMYQRR